ncbi:MAG: CehA/McbA family metallohydrolase [Planctomycetota bacterium]|nr:CehA/McbA family metallohydrolase [Planctomycetota bacterium]MDA1179844.1 CehA/McbA family metallohydrolase [Planctomycetota bacterium]
MKKQTMSLIWGVLSAVWFTTGGPHVLAEESAEPRPATCKVLLELIDQETGATLPGVIRVRDESGKLVPLDGLMERGLGIPEELPIHDWYVLPKPTYVELPRSKLIVEGFSGLETELGRVTLDLRERTESAQETKLPLRRFYDAHAKGLQNANTHVHLKKIGLADSQRYMVDVARSDGLEIVYISYLERAEEDLEYTSNKYSKDDIDQLTRRSFDAARSHTHTHPHQHRHATEFDNGEEHRHNFEGFNEGYGHVMFLRIPEWIQPVSIGPGITQKGTDSPPLSQGIQLARQMGTTVIWCHNRWGMEDIPNWLAGHLHANNIFDGGTRGSYKHSFYRYLNAGLKVPFSTGTDWFIYDFSRVYIVADPGTITSEKYLNSEEWLAYLARGRSFITNGPILEFTVNGQQLGDTVQLAQAGKVHITGRAVGRQDFSRIELIRNGNIVDAKPSRATDGHFEARLDVDLVIDKPCWLALRTPAPSDPEYPEFQRKTPLNEYGRELFSHTSAIYVDIDGRKVFEIPAAEDLIREMVDNQKFIQSKGTFADDQERAMVMRVYDEGISTMKARIRTSGMVQDSLRSKE